MRTFTLTGRGWRSLIYRYLVVTVFCALNAAQEHVIWPPWSYPLHWAYVQYVGTACWGIIEAGLSLLRRPTDTGIWPHGEGVRAGLVAVAGLVLGFFIGS